MNCKECGSELNAESSFCNKCGAKVEPEVPAETKPSETPVPAAPKKKLSKLTIIIGSIVLAVLLIGGILAGVLIGSAEAYKKYEAKFSTTYMLILTESAWCESSCNDIQSTWSNAIKNKKNFKTEVATLMANNESLSKKHLDTKVIISDAITKLQNPPKEYADAYKALLDAYTGYASFLSMATSPTGSLNSFSQEFREIDQQVVTLTRKVGVLMPEKKK